MSTNAPSVEIVSLPLRPENSDVKGLRVQRLAKRDLGIDTGCVRHAKVFAFVFALRDDQLSRFAHEVLADRVLHDPCVGAFPLAEGFARALLLRRLPGVTDDEGVSAQAALCDWLGQGNDGVQRIFTQEHYLFERALNDEALQRLARDLLGNPLIHEFEYGTPQEISPRAAVVKLRTSDAVATLDLEIDDDALLTLSRQRVLSLDLREMHAIRDHYRDTSLRQARRKEGLPNSPTDCELEVFAQTWSEHCKHKEFSASIDMHDHASDRRYRVDGLFASYIRAATETIQRELKQAGRDWLIKVFDDNAGVVRIDAERLFVFKVETHNSPSALDPYGGALTGILGNNRDPMGTGRGGARLLFNTDVLCFGPPDHDTPLLPGQLHPARVMHGVRQGIEDGGNKCGVPTVNGALIFDSRFAGKPLVYCGTGAILPAQQAGRESWVKEICVGDRVVMAGGRVGHDGIHGATFSSAGIDEHAPRNAVQVGSPITQKRMFDFLQEACARGLVRCCTDNGAGGLASSVGELATICGGAEVDLAQVPLKYPGLRPWEIFVSESQERMTLVVDPEEQGALWSLAADFEVELSDMGRFTDDGWLRVRHGERLVACLDLGFLHEGVPRKHLRAEWFAPETRAAMLPANVDASELLLRLLGSLDICSREAVIRQYDHEVQGLSVLKPLMGPRACGPQDAAVLRLDHRGYRGLAVSCGIAPRYGDLDPYHMSAGAFDEAVRQIIAVGGRLPDPQDPESPWWSACDNFCVPDSVYDPQRNPDGKLKLGKLVRMCEGLHDAACAYGVPLTSGKDSMKNDFVAGDTKISVPPTVLYSMVAGIDDVRRVTSSDFKAPGDHIYLLGETHDELGASCLLRLFDQLGERAPKLRFDHALDLYRRVQKAQEKGLLASCHDLSDGGLAVALAESAFGGWLGARVQLDDHADLNVLTLLFAESHSRFVASVRSDHRVAFEAIMGSRCTHLGLVSLDPVLRVHQGAREILCVEVERLHATWSRAGEVLA